MMNRLAIVVSTPAIAGHAPSGSGAGAFTILRAETKWGVVVRAARNGGSQYNVILNAPTTHHIRLEGLLIDGEHGVAGMEACLGTYRSHDLQFLECRLQASCGRRVAGVRRQPAVSTCLVLLGRRGHRWRGDVHPWGAERLGGLSRILYASRGARGRGAAHHGPILIEDSLLEEVNGYGVQTYYGNVTLRNTVVKNAYQGGALVVGANMDVYNTLVINPGIWGIRAGMGS